MRKMRIPGTAVVVSVRHHPDDSRGFYRVSERRARSIERQCGEMPRALAPITPQQGSEYWIFAP